jgi:hypothetical protein
MHSTVPQHGLIVVSYTVLAIRQNSYNEYNLEWLIYSEVKYKTAKPNL